MDKIVVYIHGKGGNKDEADFYKPIFEDYDVVGLEYKSETPWDTKEEFPKVLDNVLKKYNTVIIVANSIGAYFAMNALSDAKIEKAFFISPIVDMQKLILDMMSWANVSEEELKEKGEVEASFGEKLSWDYLSYVRNNTITWNVPTHVLYGSKDNLTSLETISQFVKRHNSTLTIMENGEHWFHTEEQMNFIKQWIEKYK